MQYSAHAPFVAPARSHPQLWRLGLGVLLTIVIYGLGIGAVFLLVVAWSGFDGAQRWMDEITSKAGPTGTLLLLTTFIGMALGPMFAARLLHGRKMKSLFGPISRVWRDFLVALAASVAFYAILSLVPLPTAAPLPNLDIAIWASFLPLALVGVLLQTGAEEVLFRGYLQQQLAARFSSPVVWMVIPSVLFAALHYQPEIMGPNTWLMMGAVLVFALLAADLTAVSGNIGAAWGLHFANNAMAILIVATDGPLSGLALFVSPVMPSSEEIRPLFYLDIATTVALWAIIRLLLRSRATGRARTS